jgi:hypothetical protein
MLAGDDRPVAFDRSACDGHAVQLFGVLTENLGRSADHIRRFLRRQTLVKSDIAERELQDISPMSGGIVKTPAELSALMAYLLRCFVDRAATDN